jgi:hypothetical protein
MSWCDYITPELTRFGVTLIKFRVVKNRDDRKSLDFPRVGRAGCFHWMNEPAHLNKTKSAPALQHLVPKPDKDHETFRAELGQEPT